MTISPIYSKQLHSEAELLAFGACLAQALQPGMVVYLQGQLGAGKTTLTRGFLRGLGYPGKVKSPTYTLVEPYSVAGWEIYHFDLYRLRTAEELIDIGLHDYFHPNAICLIEWPEKGFPILPSADLDCRITIHPAGRDVKIEAKTLAGAASLTRMV